MKVYLITREGAKPKDTTAKVTVLVAEDGETKKVKPFLFHSPTGVNFGYGGSGPADLALTILVDYLDEQPNQVELRNGGFWAWKLHQKFKNRFCAPPKGLSFSIAGYEIDQFLQEVENGA